MVNKSYVKPYFWAPFGISLRAAARMQTVTGLDGSSHVAPLGADAPVRELREVLADLIERQPGQRLVLMGGKEVLEDVQKP